MQARLGQNPFPDRAGIMRDKSGGGAKKADPTAFKKAFGDKGLDQVLNQMTDPSYSAKSKRVNGVGNPELGKDAFFKLMLEQLKQQDPTNPLKSHEMAAQLAQFSSVEQLSNISESIKKLGSKEDNSQYELLNLIGKVVSGDSSKVKRVAGDKEHRIEFQLSGAAEKVKVKIKDASGNLVKQYEVQNLKPGKNSIVWGGLNEEGKDLPVGDYRAEISATMAGRKISTSTKFKGAVDGVQFTKQGPMLMVEGKSMALKDVQKIEINKKKAPVAAMNRYQNNMGQAMTGAMPTVQMPQLGQAMSAAKPAAPVAPKANVAPKPEQPKQIDPNNKYSKGAFEPKPVLANLDSVKMDPALKAKLMK